MAEKDLFLSKRKTSEIGNVEKYLFIGFIVVLLSVILVDTRFMGYQTAPYQSYDIYGSPSDYNTFQGVIPRTPDYDPSSPGIQTGPSDYNYPSSSPSGMPPGDSYGSPQMPA